MKKRVCKSYSTKKLSTKIVIVLIILLFGLLLMGCDNIVAEPTATVAPPTPKPTATPPVANTEPRQVVILFSYESDFWATIQEDQGIVDGLAAMGYVEGDNVEITRLFMNTKTVNTTPELKAEAAVELIAEIESIDPDVLLIHDDDALRSVGSQLYDTDLPIVFAGINGFPDDESYTEIGALADSFAAPGHNITGILERVSLAAGFELLNEVVPEAETALFISDNSAVTNLLMAGSGGAEQLEQTAIEVVEQLYTDDFEELKATVIEYQDKVDAIILFLPWSIFDENGDHVPQNEVVGWMLKNNQRPGIAYLDILAEEGYLTGVVVDMNQQGFQAAQMVGQILDGADPGELPITDPIANRIMINLARADQLGIEVPFDILTRSDGVFTEMTAYPEYEMSNE